MSLESLLSLEQRVRLHAIEEMLERHTDIDLAIDCAAKVAGFILVGPLQIEMRFVLESIRAIIPTETDTHPAPQAEPSPPDDDSAGCAETPDQDQPTSITKSPALEDTAAAGLAESPEQAVSDEEKAQPPSPPLPKVVTIPSGPAKSVEEIITSLRPSQRAIVNAAMTISGPTFNAQQIVAISGLPRGTVSGELTRLIQNGVIIRHERGLYSLSAVLSGKRKKPTRQDELAAIDAHIRNKGTMTRPDFGDETVNKLWADLKARGHSLVRLPIYSGGNGRRPYRLDNSPGLTVQELTARAKTIIATEKPISEFKQP